MICITITLREDCVTFTHPAAPNVPELNIHAHLLLVILLIVKDDNNYFSFLNVESHY